MRIRLETLKGEVLSKICRNVSPVKYESNVKRNTLFDGTYHIQIIGKPIRYIELTAVASEPQVEMLSLIESIGEPLKLIDIDREYIGLIDSTIDFKRLTSGYVDRFRRIYEGSIKLILTDVGDII